jgi:hypothetical protein
MTTIHKKIMSAICAAHQYAAKNRSVTDRLGKYEKLNRNHWSIIDYITDQVSVAYNKSRCYEYRIARLQSMRRQFAKWQNENVLQQIRINPQFIRTYNQDIAPFADQEVTAFMNYLNSQPRQTLP